MEGYAEMHNHLPDVPRAPEMEKRGMSVGDMNLQLLKTMEETTLHMIEMEKELRELKTHAGKK